jgi:hypothetical protein
MERIMDHPDLVDFYVSQLEKAAGIAATPPASPETTPALDTPAPGSQKGWLETEVQREYDQIKQFALDDPFKPHSNGEFEAAIQQMLVFARERANFVRVQVDRHFGR